MRWPHPKENALRTRGVWALFPTQCDDGFTYWLERVILWERHVGDNLWFREGARPLAGQHLPSAPKWLVDHR